MYCYNDVRQCCEFQVVDAFELFDFILVHFQNVFDGLKRAAQRYMIRFIGHGW